MISPHHQAMLDASAITPDVAAERGYRSVTDPAELRALGFGEYQALPGLLIPIHGVTGTIETYQLRPDKPRIRDGKALKYETPTGGRLCLDVPPRTRPYLGDPHCRLWITEGSRKVDALVSRGECAIGLMGVYGWRGTNEHGGKAALPDWESVALNDGREVILCLDSDITTKATVRDALERLYAFLERRGAKVRVVYLPDLPDGRKAGVDDWLGLGWTIADVLRHVEDGLRPPSSELPSFPTQLMPPAFRALVEEASAALSVPESYLAVPMLATAAAAAGRIEVEIKRGLRERLNLFAVVVAPPGSGKSQAQEEATRPLRVLQAEAWRTFQDALTEWEHLPDEERKATSRPVLEHFYASDTTLEALIGIAAQSPSFLVLRDELAQWLGSFDQYRKGGDRAAWLSIWSGSALKVDRVSKDTVVIPRLSISLCGGMQPDLLPTLRHAAGDDGLIDRMLPTMEPPLPFRGWSEAEISDLTRANWQRLIYQLTTHRPLEGQEATVVMLSLQAKGSFVRWFNEINGPQLDAYSPARGFAAKAIRTLPRLIGILHALSHPLDIARPVAVDTVEAAIEVMEFFRAHHAAMVRAIGGQSLPAIPAGVAGRIVRRLLRSDDPEGWVSQTDLFRSVSESANTLQMELAALIAAGTVERKRVDNPRGKPTTLLRLSSEADHTEGAFTVFTAFTSPEEDGRPDLNTVSAVNTPRHYSDPTPLPTRPRKRTHCITCGAPLPEGSMARCPRCVEAAQLARTGAGDD